MFGFVCRSLAVVSSRSFDRAIGEQLKKQTSEQKNKKRIKEVEKRANEMRERLLKKSKELREKAKKGTEEKVEPKKNKKKVLIDA
ncbi:hypothetical protein N8550_03425 [Pirellulaceae bacterium]|nr:hypothetical protein [Pirellulaceae bacterium]